MKANDLSGIKYDAQMDLMSALNKAYIAGQSEDALNTKQELEDALKHAQEAYGFFKVVMNRFCISENHLDPVTKSYLREIGNHLKQIKGIKE